MQTKFVVICYEQLQLLLIHKHMQGTKDQRKTDQALHSNLTMLFYYSISKG